MRAQVSDDVVIRQLQVPQDTVVDELEGGAMILAAQLEGAPQHRRGKELLLPGLHMGQDAANPGADRREKPAR